MGIQGYTGIFRGIQGYSGVYRGIQGYTGVAREKLEVPGMEEMHQILPAAIGLVSI